METYILKDGEIAVHMEELGPCEMIAVAKANAIASKIELLSVKGQNFKAMITSSDYLNLKKLSTVFESDIRFKKHNMVQLVPRKNSKFDQVEIVDLDLFDSIN